MSDRPRALVYRGPAACDGCPEAVAQLLRSSQRQFMVQYAGPNEAIKVSPDSLNDVDLYAHPGGPGTAPFYVCDQFGSPVSPCFYGDLDDAYRETKAYASAIRNFVSSGGRYLGFCLGAYLAGYSPGYGLLPKGSDTDTEIEQKQSQVKNDEDTIIQVDWTFVTGPETGKTARHRWVYFQEGPVIKGFCQSKTSFILARYSKSQDIAATVHKYGQGWVGLVGPHPEATQEWFASYDIQSPDGLQFELGYDLVEATMTGGQLPP